MKTSKLKLLVNGEAFEISVLEETRSDVLFEVGGRRYKVSHQESVPQEHSSPEKATRPSSPKKSKTASASAKGQGKILAPIPGVVVEVLAQIGQEISAGETLLRLEAMKMENNITSNSSGIVVEILVQAGDEVMEGDLLLVIS